MYLGFDYLCSVLSVWAVGSSSISKSAGGDLWTNHLQKVATLRQPRPLTELCKTTIIRACPKNGPRVQKCCWEGRPALPLVPQSTPSARSHFPIWGTHSPQKSRRSNPEREMRRWEQRTANGGKTRCGLFPSTSYSSQNTFIWGANKESNIAAQCIPVDVGLSRVIRFRCTIQQFVL